MTDQVEKARVEMDSAMREIKKGLVARQGGTANEQKYVAAYNQLAALGAEPRLRSRYRVGRHMKQVR